MLFTLQRYEFFSKSQRRHWQFLTRIWCCLPYKGTNFSANHNYINDVMKFLLMLFTLQRYEFFSKSQLIFIIIIMVYRCCLPYKGTNFSANHNASRYSVWGVTDVVYPTKVRIFQQITTRCKRTWNSLRMLFTLQRYEFFSKSQQALVTPNKQRWCCLPYKGTNFSANHNVSLLCLDSCKMLFTLQRYEFFSKSQLASRNVL